MEAWARREDRVGDVEGGVEEAEEDEEEGGGLRQLWKIPINEGEGVRGEKPAVLKAKSWC